MKNTNKKAFTLVELLVVIAIIAILFVVLISKVDFAVDKAKTTGVQTDFRSYQMAMHTVGIEYQGYPENIDELANLLNKNLDRELEVVVDGSELKSNAKDPWGTNYKLTYTIPEGTRGEIIVHSAGPDMQFNTADDLTITSTYSVNAETPGVNIESNAGVSGGVNNSNGENNNTPSDPIIYDMLDEPGVATDVSELVFRSAAELEDLVGVTIIIDGETHNLTRDVDYTATEGSTIITLTEEFAATLENGTYTLNILSKDGLASSSFELDVIRPFISLAPGLYPAGTINKAWNNEIETATPTKTWEELVNEGLIVMNSQNQLNYLDSSLSGDLIVSDEIERVSEFAYTSLNAIYFGINTTNISTNQCKAYIDAPSVKILGDSNMIRLYLSPNVEDLICSGGINPVESVTIHPDNKNFVIQDKFLLSSDRKTFIAFVGYYGDVSDMVIPNGIETISEYALRSAGAYSIFIPKTVIQIGEYAFDSYPLSDIYYEGTEEEWNQIIIEENYLSNVTIHFNCIPN
jgi:general secretion pathway protein G